jgi:hypothetical protein
MSEGAVLIIFLKGVGRRNQKIARIKQPNIKRIIFTVSKTVVKILGGKRQ